METYHVVVTREDHNWLATVPDLRGAHTDACGLSTLDGYVREVIALVGDLPEGAEDQLDLEYEFHTGDHVLDAWSQRTVSGS